MLSTPNVESHGAKQRWFPRSGRRRLAGGRTRRAGYHGLRGRAPLQTHCSRSLRAFWPAFPIPRRSHFRSAIARPLSIIPFKATDSWFPRKSANLSSAAPGWATNSTIACRPNMVVLRCFLGGDAMALDDEAIVDAARARSPRIMGLEAEPVFHNIARWPNSMAQYTVGHAKRVERIEELVARDSRSLSGRQRVSRHRHSGLRSDGPGSRRKNYCRT